MNLLQRAVASRRQARSIDTIDDYALALQSFMFNGNTYGGLGIQQTLVGGQAERIPNDLTGYATAAYASNGPVFALMAVRMLVFSAIRFQFQRLSSGRPGDLFGNADLALLETPWTGGTTQDLLTSMILDIDLAGNAYLTKVNGELVRLRPDWVSIVLEPRRFRGGILGYRRIGYLYEEGGLGFGDGGIPLLPDEVAHFAPYPDPLATYRGMSWLTPVIRELQNDKLMSWHQRKFFENGATPNLVVSLDASIDVEKFKKFKELFNVEHRGVENAYKSLFLGGGADVTVVGADFQQMSFSATQGRGETRLAAAAGVPVTVVGFSEGLQGSSLNAGNYSQARRRFADGTMHPLWQNAAGSLQQIVPTPPATRLWYDARDVPFLREDARDSAEIQGRKAATISQLIQSGYTADSIIAAVNAEDFSLLKHSGLFSVQLQPPGAHASAPAQTNGNQGP
ncbi:phage portal protein [Planotetraspora sp. A-T 1434]|uniref:phage portal protein n=1 Tax=Planotetraspora sp. A-T 1434 TaxID=2979219 RepID=UPI0021BE9CD0|nr:phage portal protein [Planotetraspora sp. A-T 1434]MCT9932438.1 phage portal protein [Planotetraspora sp. A-T 1434]